MKSGGNSGSFKPKHGRAGDGRTLKDPTYRVWKGMHQRCNYQKHKSYALYGGRGVRVCARWADFNAFVEDMGNRPCGTSLDRFPDKNGNYEPGNCRWATDKQQQRNRRSNRVIEFNGESKTLTEWAESHGIRSDTLSYRLKRGLEMAVALSLPVSVGNANFTRHGGIERWLASQAIGI